MFKRLMLLSVFAILFALDVMEARHHNYRYQVRNHDGKRRLDHEASEASYGGYSGYDNSYGNSYGQDSSYYTGYNNGANDVNSYKAAYYDKYYNNYRKGNAQKMFATGLATISAIFAVYAWDDKINIFKS